MSHGELPNASAEMPDRIHAAARGLWTRFFSSKLLVVSLLLVAVGTVLWIRDGLAAEPAPAQTTSPAASPTGGLTASPQPTAGVSAADTPTSHAPLTFRLGAGFAVGYVVGWLVRLFLRTLLLVAGSLLLLIGVLKGIGWIDFASLGLDWASVERHVHDGVEQATAQATAMKEALLALVPGGVTTFAGLVVGARRAR